MLRELPLSIKNLLILEFFYEERDHDGGTSLDGYSCWEQHFG